MSGRPSVAWVVVRRLRVRARITTATPKNVAKPAVRARVSTIRMSVPPAIQISSQLDRRRISSTPEMLQAANGAMKIPSACGWLRTPCKPPLEPAPNPGFSSVNADSTITVIPNVMNQDCRRSSSRGLR